MITYYKLVKHGIEAAAEEDSLWIHLESPDAAEAEVIADKYGLPLDYLTAALDPDEVSRTECLSQEKPDEPVLISLLYPAVEADGDQAHVYTNRMLSIILHQEKIVTCAGTNPPFLDAVLDNQLELVTSLEGTGSLVIELAWQVACSYILAIRRVREEVGALQAKLNQSTETEDLLRLADLDKSIVFISSAIEANKPVLRDLSEARYIVQGDRELAWLHDVHVENHQADSMSRQTRHMLEQLDTTFSSIIQHNLNQTMKILTSLTIIITLPGIIFGFWGMNIALPFARSPYGTVFIIALTAVLTLAAVILLRRKRLL